MHLPLTGTRGYKPKCIERGDFTVGTRMAEETRRPIRSPRWWKFLAVMSGVGLAVMIAEVGLRLLERQLWPGWRFLRGPTSAFECRKC